STGAAGNVGIFANGSLRVGAAILSDTLGTGAGGTVELLAQGKITTGDIFTMSTNGLAGSVTVASNGSDVTGYSISMTNLNTSGSPAGSIEVVSLDSGNGTIQFLSIASQATSATGVGGSVGIAALGPWALGAIDTTNTAASASSPARSGS